MDRHWRDHGVGNVGADLAVDASDCIASAGFGKVPCHCHVVQRNRRKVALATGPSAAYDPAVGGGYLRGTNPDHITDDPLTSLFSCV
jgi:hypothetical protein